MAPLHRTTSPEEGTTMAYANGQLPDSALAAIPGGRLRKDAAAAWNAMNAYAIAHGHGALVVVDTYRPLGHPGDLAAGRWSQWAAWERYQHGGNLAARPGTSNHGLGLAVDVQIPRTRRIIDEIGRQFGWAKAWSDAQSESWHLKWREGTYPAVHAAPARPLRRGSQGPRVTALQRRLRALGFKSVPAPGKRGSGFYGQATASAVKRFQKAHHLTADGVVGASTTRALKSAVR